SQAMTATANLQSFHFTQVIAGVSYTQPWNIEGDYVAPDQEYSKGQLNGAEGEFLQVGTQTYHKDAGGTWTPLAQGAQTPHDLVGSFFGGVAAIAALSDFQNTGETTTLDGTSTQHFAGTISLGKMPGVAAAIAALPDLPPAGTIDLWIDPQAHTVYKLAVRIDTTAALAAAVAKLAPAGGPTAVPIPSYVFTADMTISRQNDPAIHVPSPTGGNTTPPTATPASGGAAGPTPTEASIQVASSSGHDSPSKALALSGPTHVDLTLSSAHDVVYFSFKTSAPIAGGVWSYNPQDAAGKLQVQILDASGQKEIDVATLGPGEQSSMSNVLSDPGLYLIKVTAAGLTTVPKTPAQVELTFSPLQP
ncbi:MAG TPA: LppX_LprAFG lipoprotein, partial [Chloroflexia bacterium]|nr:LppX_LprAFG lipoprotein [Chloroflexia bacterium]